MNLAFLRKYLTPHAGRFCPAQLRSVADALKPPAYFAIGPFLILMDLPERLQKADPVPSVADINARLREFFGQFSAGD